MHAFRLAIILCAFVIATPSFAARCGGDFNTFLAAMSQEAAAAGISQGVISQALSGVTQDPAVLNFDRRQRGTFHKTFEQYVSTRVGAGRINMGRQMLQRHAALLSSIEAKFGVPRQIVVAIWGLESDFGKGDLGKLPVIRTLATMAHDCRRTELFQGELLAALKIVQRGDLPLRDLIGAFAGDRPDAQFLPSSTSNTAWISTATAMRPAPQRPRRARLHRECWCNRFQIAACREEQWLLISSDARAE
jgi:membrane-bound lytic murein transglycosylase B